MLELDATKIAHYLDRFAAWECGERIAPITIDMALLPRSKCNYRCSFCFGTLQEQAVHRTIDHDVMTRFLDDAARAGVKGISLVSDGESSHSPCFAYSITYGKSLGLDMAVGTNGLTVDKRMAEEILPDLTYIRINMSAGEPGRYGEVMGVKPEWFERVCENVYDMVTIKQQLQLDVTIGLQMVLTPDLEDQVLRLASLGDRMGVDYTVIKHCSDDEKGTLGVDYEGYAKMEDTLRDAESWSTKDHKVIVKWNKIRAKGKREYMQCFGPPFHLQFSGTGLVAPCGMLFNDRFKEDFHIGNFVDQPLGVILKSKRYWEVMDRLGSAAFNAQTMCGSLCVQHHTNTAIWRHVTGKEDLYEKGMLATEKPEHLSFL